MVTADGIGVVSHAGTVLLREIAERTELRAEYSHVRTGPRAVAADTIPGRYWSTRP